MTKNDWRSEHAIVHSGYSFASSCFRTLRAQVPKIHQRTPSLNPKPNQTEGRWPNKKRVIPQSKGTVQSFEKQIVPHFFLLIPLQYQANFICVDFVVDGNKDGASSGLWSRGLLLTRQPLYQAEPSRRTTSCLLISETQVFKCFTAQTMLKSTILHSRRARSITCWTMLNHSWRLFGASSRPGGLWEQTNSIAKQGLRG